MKGKKLLIIFIIICFIAGIIAVLLYIKPKEKKENNYYTYAIIFYPDHKTTVEGYVDKFVWGSDFVSVTINGEKYISSPENIVIVKRKDLIVNKEESNEINNN